jgi:uncharacterized Fe-S cluster-containing radical SAM superfamily protein
MNLSDYLNNFFKQNGFFEDNLLNNMKKRNIRIQLCMKGLDVENLANIETSDSEIMKKVNEVLQAIKT